ncbi:hypothetical protein BXY66_1198 [Shimia isoporae]|uniref:Uncharacterized protein n=1 Tax=Shimia isoporae TaxID=647720 RepID=A0A4R1NQZ7_9RHOB|nr:hypothetical protein [Shimia isoporae]TCL09153.1 hypothetical protein BXY66_1198 [Shimia isoporae]
MSPTLKPVAALLSITLLISCGDTAPKIEVPPDVLAVPDKPLLPEAGAGNAEAARYLVRTEEWMDAASDQIATLAAIVCTLTGQGCPGQGAN